MNAHITLSSPLKTDGIYINTSVGDALEFLIWFLENHKLTTAAGEDRRIMAIAIAKGIMSGIRDGIDPSVGELLQEFDEDEKQNPAY